MLARAPESSRAPRSPETDDRTPRPHAVQPPRSPRSPSRSCPSLRRRPAPTTPDPRGPHAATRAGCSASSPPSSRSSCSRAAWRWATAARSRAGPARTAARPPDRVPAAAGADLALIEEAWKAIQDNYVDAQHLDDRDLAYGAIRGMTEAVGDEGHTSFLTADEAKAVDQSLSGTFVGIGVQLDEDESKGPIIRSIIPGTPAEEAGLRARRPDRRGRRQDDRWRDHRRGRVAGPRPRGRARHADDPARRGRSRSTSRSPASSSTCRW